MALLKIYDDIANEEKAVAYNGTDQKIFSADYLRDFLASTDDSSIDGHLHCKGGSVPEGYACHDLLQQSGKEISMTVDGMCASIATVILLSAPLERRSIYPNGQVMIHMPYAPKGALNDNYTSEQLTDIANYLISEEERLLDFYVPRTGADREELRSLMKAETTLSAVEAKRLGFVSRILPALNNQWREKLNINQINSKMENKELNDTLAKHDSILDRMLKKLGMKSDPVNLTLTDATGQTLTVERETGDAAVGDIASPDGTFTMEDGKVITVSGGAITEIDEPAPAEDAKDKEIADLKAEIETLKGANTQAAADLETQLAEAKTTIAEAVALKTELSGLKSKFFPEGRQQSFNEPPVSKVQEKINRRKAEIEAKKVKK